MTSGWQRGARRLRWIDMRADPRPMAYFEVPIVVNGEAMEVEVGHPVAGVGVDGCYHTGLVLDTAVVDRAVRLTLARELRMAGVAEWKREKSS